MKYSASTIEALIEDIRSVIQHRDATQWRLDTISAGAPAPTIGSDDDTRIFAFPPTVTTAAYLAQFRDSDVGQLREDLASIQLPVLAQFEAQAQNARATVHYRGLRRLFRPRPVAGEEALAWMSSVDTYSIHSILSGIDAALGSTDHNEFIGLNPEGMQGLIERDLTHITGWPIQWITAEDVNNHISAVAAIRAAKATEHRLETEVQRASSALCAAQAEQELARTDINVLEHITDGRLRLHYLKHLTLPRIAASQVSELMRIDGVGEKTAQQAIAAARSYAQDIAQSQVPIINYQDKIPSTAYVTALANLLTYRDNLRNLPTAPLTLAPVDPGTLVALAGTNDLLTADDAQRYQRPFTALSSDDAWNIYAIRAAEFHAYGDHASAGDVPDEVAQRIADITLTGTLHASLRGYQAFGAKFILAQKRVLIGDEMGLGKTMQALAVCAHLAKQGKKHALVVCPPSLRINWARELATFTDLNTYMLHGDDKDINFDAWKHNAGVAIAGFPETREGKLLRGQLDVPLDFLVVDEAHRAKNPDSQQSQGVQALTDSAEYAVYLTGTPLENRLSEFETLLSYLDKGIIDAVEAARGRATSFRNAISSLYLRRNQEDVLGELPPLMEINEWVEPKPSEVEEYNNAVERGDFMDMRRAFSGAESAKMQRVLELLDDGAEAGKTIIFTFFRSVVDQLMNALGERAFGPIAGGVSHEQRQKAVDEFTTAEAGVVLVCQITAASEGLNIQAANHIVLFEPQLNPAIEAQAIARAHRMGQVRTVEVHRLLTPDSVDEQLMEMLEIKRGVFDRFARDSVVAESTPEAVDVSDAALIDRVIAAERERLGQEPRLTP